MSHDVDPNRLRHMVDAVREILDFVGERDRQARRIEQMPLTLTFSVIERVLDE